MLTLTNPRQAGTAYLEFSRTESRTVLTRAFATSPMKLFSTRERQSACWVYSATLGGGLVGGDELHLTVDVAAGARALLATQASTKVYRSLRPARQTLRATIHAGGLLAVVPDPIVCFAGADFTQAQRYDLRGDASLVMVDWMTSGRHAAGERWAFSRYESRIDIRRDERRVLVDGVVLDHCLDSVAARMGRFNVILTAVIVGPLVAEAVTQVLESTARLPIVPHADCVESVAALTDGGLLLRMAGTNLEDITCRLRGRLAFLSALVGDDLWSRKW